VTYSDLVHSAGVTMGKVHDAKVMANLIREDDTAVYGDKGYASDEKKRAAEAAGVLWAVKEKAKPSRALTKPACTQPPLRQGACLSASSIASSAIARSAIAASPRTARWVSRSTESANSPASHRE
jgi:IS5 family transposase